MEENEDEVLILEDIEKPGEISDEPVFGKNVREIRLGSRHTKVKVDHSYCTCGKPLTKENAVRCSHCKKLYCNECGISYLNEIHCKECLRVQHRIYLPKDDYSISLCISNEFQRSNSIFKLTGIEPQTVKARIDSLMNTYFTNKPTSLLERIFPKLRLTSLGNDALTIFDSIYGKQVDVQVLKKKIEELKTQRKTYSILQKDVSKNERTKVS
jgi:hypothetical protein